MQRGLGKFYLATGGIQRTQVTVAEQDRRARFHYAPSLAAEAFVLLEEYSTRPSPNASEKVLLSAALRELRELRGVSQSVALSITPYFVKVPSPLDQSESNQPCLFLQQHTRSGLLIPIGGGKVDAHDLSIDAALKRECSEETGRFPKSLPVTVRGSSLFDVAWIRDSKGFEMLDLRFAFALLDPEFRDCIPYREAPTAEGMIRGDDAYPVPLDLLISWEDTAEATGCAGREFSPITAAQARQRDPRYFERFRKLAVHLVAAQQESALSAELVGFTCFPGRNSQLSDSL